MLIKNMIWNPDTNCPSTDRVDLQIPMPCFDAVMCIQLTPGPFHNNKMHKKDALT